MIQNHLVFSTCVVFLSLTTDQLCAIINVLIIRETKYKFQYISHIIRNLILLLFFLMDDCKDNISVFVFIFTTNFGESFKGGTSLFFGKVLLGA